MINNEAVRVFYLAAALLIRVRVRVVSRSRMAMAASCQLLLHGSTIVVVLAATA